MLASSAARAELPGLAPAISETTATWIFVGIAAAAVILTLLAFHAIDYFSKRERDGEDGP